MYPKKLSAQWILPLSHLANTGTLSLSNNAKIGSVIRDYYDEAGKQVFGQRKLIRGEATFFLRPGEVLEAVRDIYILGLNVLVLFSLQFKELKRLLKCVVKKNSKTELENPLSGAVLAPYGLCTDLENIYHQCKLMFYASGTQYFPMTLGM